jgi:ABC-type lipoprotein export system ATPase subunit
MKVENIKIQDYKQFHNFELNLTYPKGHKKEGQPLDKICIIGQSGTGKTNLLKIINDFTTDGLHTFHNNIKIKKTYIKSKSEKSEKVYFIDVSKDENNQVWDILKNKIDNYHNARLEYINKLSNKLLNIDKYEKKDFKNDVDKWENKNINLLEQISDRINQIIIKFNLKLTKIDKNQRSYDELIFKDLSSRTIINYEDVSTGTKNLLATFIPLKIYDPKDSIILIDEPENSFYPDIQRKLIDLYMEVGENNQLIVATHSPLIASSFEPWEVVELKFDENNQVYRKKYYDGDNHIDNYTLDPRVLTWTGILTDIFDLKEDSNFIFREKKLMEYALLKSEISSISDIKEKEKLFKELQRIGKQLGIYNQ